MNKNVIMFYFEKTKIPLLLFYHVLIIDFFYKKTKKKLFLNKLKI